MYQFNQLTYAAIISINVPGQAEPVQAHVRLMPPDVVETPEGSKLLRECTLAELQQYAEKLEAEVWATQGQITLHELATQGEALVDLVVIRDGAEPLPVGEAWLAGARLVLEEEANTVDVPTAVDMHPPLPDVEELPITDLGSSTEKSKPETEHPAINVAQTEPIHAEREAQTEAAPTSGEPPLLKVRKADLPNRTAGQKLKPFSRTNTAVDILCDEIPFREAQAHANTSMNREVAGVLVGPHPEKQPDGRYVVHITDIIIAQHTKMQGASVTYTPESWRYVNDVMQERYPQEECVIVGWYHTHPGFGIFLSNMDLFIHHNFFTQKWHIALVLDPVGQRSGFFVWDKEQTSVLAYDFPWPYWAHRSW
jgi:proteasome lid subunit RPN8/RPN11